VIIIIIFMIIIINIIILCVSSKHAKCYKIWICGPRKNYLYWILNVEIHLDVMGLSNTIKEINKSSEQLIYSC